MFEAWSELRRYRSERFPGADWCGVAALVLLAGLSRDYVLEPLKLAGAFALIWCTLFQLRLLDDLSSLRRDSLSHPERLLVVTGNRKAFAVWCFILIVAPLVAFIFYGESRPIVLFLGAQLVACAALVSECGPWPAVAMLKYAFLVLVAAATTGTAAAEASVPAIAVWSAFVAQELSERRRLSASSRGRRSLLEKRWPFLLALIVLLLWRLMWRSEVL